MNRSMCTEIAEFQALAGISDENFIGINWEK